MGETPAAPERSTVGRRLSILLLLLIVFGAPALVTTSLVTQDIMGEVTRGDQPGGTLSGVVVDAEGEPIASHTVALWLVPMSGDASEGPSTTTDAEGRFALAAPPVVGSYVLRAGGELLQRATKGISFLDPKGETIEPKPVTLELLPGAVLELDFVDADGEAATDGSFTFEGTRLQGGFLLGFVPYPVKGSGSFSEGHLRIDGLPPAEGTLDVEFDSGETVALDLRIEAGLNESRVEIGR